MFTVLNQIRGKRVQDVIWMERTVAWLHSLTQLGGKKSLQFTKSKMSCTSLDIFVFPVSPQSYETC